MKNYLLNLSTPKKLAALAGFLAIFALVIGNSGSKNKISVNAKELALSAIKDQDKISAMTLADWIIKDKLDFTLVDLRSEKEFTEYTIPGSVNVRMEDLLNSDLKRNQKLLLFGNDDISSAQAWFILKSSGYDGVYILNGGLNSWKNEILYPKRNVNLTLEDSIKFEKIKQVSIHFGGNPQVRISESTSDAAITTSHKIAPPLPKITIPAGTNKKKKEGC
ncbi:MAG: rhodanese-like domain-containing protein [Ignavibacteriaceae bacterium]|nr:rhodanese-like domain-containing protein [Ignavibacteriaceae bacterium]